jgi:putative FmdB family regulatory protein
MPTYRYQCATCGEQFELWQSIHDDALERHPGCGGPVTKVMAPAGIVLKGPGFYRTDSRSAGKRGAADKEPAKDGAGSNGSGSDAKGKQESTSPAKSDTTSSDGATSKGDAAKGSKGATSKSGSSPS